MKDKLKEKINEIVNTAKNEGRDLTDDEQLLVDALTFQLKSLSDDDKDTEVSDTEEVKKEKKDDETEKPDAEDDSNKKEDEDVKEVDENKEESDTPEADDTKKEEDAEVPENEEVEEEEDKEKTNKDNRNININMNKEFKLIRAISQMANGQALDEVTAAVCEAGRNEMRSAGVSAEGGIILPTEKRDITVTDSVGASVGVDVADILAPLRDNLVLVQAGARYMSGLKNDLKLPYLLGSEAKWASEVGNVTDDTASVSGVTLTPKRISVILPVSKQFLMQSSASAESILQKNIVDAIAEKLQKTILSNVVNDATAPKGIFAATPASAKTYKAICDLEATVDAANGGTNRAYIVGNKAKAALRQLQKGTANTQMVYNAGEIDGTTCLSTSSAPENGVLYGDFSQLYIGQFGGIEVIVDQYTRAAKGEVVLTCNAYFDAALVRPNCVVSGDVTKA